MSDEKQDKSGEGPLDGPEAGPGSAWEDVKSRDGSTISTNEPKVNDSTLSACEKCDEYLAGWKRALADYDNLKKDLSRIRSEMRQDSKIDAIQMILPIIDNFEQATKFIPKNIEADIENWLKGIMHVQTQLEDVLKDMGAEKFGQIGDEFDPNQHDAIEQREDGEIEDQIILEIIQPGWKIGETLIRPAKVIVNNLK